MTNHHISPKSSLTRRTFLRRAATAAAVVSGGPLIVPGRTLGLGGEVAPSDRIAMGFIGTGRQTTYANIPGFLHQPDAQVIAVCDVDAWRMENARKIVDEFYRERSASAGYKACATLEDWRDLIARQDIDAVMIGTPDHWHALMAVAALRAGKDVSCEKPLTRSIAEGRLICDTVIRYERVFCTDSEFRFIPDFRQAAQLVRNGKIGELKRIVTSTPKDPTLAMPPDQPAPADLNYEMWLGPAPAKPYTEQRVHPPRRVNGRPGWLCVGDYADGMLANWGAHLNDIAMWANDTEGIGPVEIEAVGTYHPRENLWNIIHEFEATFRFAKGAPLTCKTDRPLVRFEGSEGWIEVPYGKRMITQPESLASWRPGPNDLALPVKHSEKRDFLDAVTSRKQPLYTAEEGHRTASLSHLALAAIDVGRKLNWDPVAETVIGDQEANDRLEPNPFRAPWKL